MHPMADKLAYVVGPLLVDLPDRDLIGCGTCFIVAAMGEYAIGVTATHSVQHATTLDVPSRVAPHASSIFRFDEGRKEWRKIKVITHLRHDDMLPFLSYTLEVVEAYSRPDLDVCLLLLHAEQQPTLEMCSRIRLLSAPPAVGDKVLVAGFFDTDVRASHKIAADGGAVFVAVNAKFQCVESTVTAVFNDGVRGINFPCFQVDTPFFSGMSGGCVLKEQDGEWLACGSISSDLDLDIVASGDQAMAAQLWPALFTQLSETKKYVYTDKNGIKIEKDIKIIHDLVEAGAIDDLSDALLHVSLDDTTESRFPLRWD